jgi:hypothetical protein
MKPFGTTHEDLHGRLGAIAGMFADFVGLMPPCFRGWKVAAIGKSE